MSYDMCENVKPLSNLSNISTILIQVPNMWICHYKTAILLK